MDHEVKENWCVSLLQIWYAFSVFMYVFVSAHTSCLMMHYILETQRTIFLIEGGFGHYLTPQYFKIIVSYVIKVCVTCEVCKWQKYMNIKMWKNRSRDKFTRYFSWK